MENTINITINNSVLYLGDNLLRFFFPEDSSFVSDTVSDTPDSIIFTKKAKREAKIPTILDALKKSVERRRDKTRAFVEELQEWQKEEYIDAHYNARVMYDELVKIVPLSFGYEVFKKYYNNTI